MAKTFTVLTENQVITAVVAKKTTLVNSSQVSLYLTDSDTDQALSALPFEAKQGVLNNLFRVKAGESKSLSAGTYNLSFDYSYSPSAVLISE